MKTPSLSPQMRKYTVAAVIGNGLENYDFAIFGYMTPLLAKHFFSSASASVSLLYTFAIFSVGFFGRPIGAFLFGQLGDRKGRKKSLLMSLLLMAVSTGLMGFLPTYSRIGLWAPILLTLLRVFQGISIGGEYSGCLSYLLEHAPPERKGFVASWMNIGTCLGLLTGASASLLARSFLTLNSFEAWGWRIAFILGLAIAALGYYLRQKMTETPLFLELKQKHTLERHPFKKVISAHWKETIQSTCVIIPLTVWTYLLFIYLPTRFTGISSLSFTAALSITMLPLTTTLLFLPLGGYLSDKWGIKKSIAIGLIIMSILAPLLFYTLEDGRYVFFLLFEIVFTFFLSLSAAPANVLLVELFPTNVRNTGTAFSYSIIGIFGGLTPLVLTWLSLHIGGIFGPLSWVSVTGLMGILALKSVKRVPLLVDDKEISSSINYSQI